MNKTGSSYDQKVAWTILGIKNWNKINKCAIGLARKV